MTNRDIRFAMFYLMHHRLGGLALTLMLLLATVASGLAHHAPMSPKDVEKQTFALFWGEQVAELCAVPGQDGDGLDRGDCDACRLVGAAVLPSADFALIDAELRFADALLVPASVRTFGRIHDPAHAVRAPPLA